MADDDLDMLQQLLQMAEDDDASDASDGRKERTSPVRGPASHENLPPNKKPRLTETAKPLAAAFQSATRDSAGPASSSASTPAPQTKTGAVEKFSGLRMKNPCLPSVVLKERLSHMRFEKLSQARSKVGADAKWATIAVVTEKSTKESANGSVYGIWRLSDLQGTNVSLFLFGKAQTGLWKETEGSVVALFNPEGRIADSKFSMSVDSEQQVVKLGTSTDMGFCRSRKKDGTPCRNAVNIAACPFCDYHVQSEYNKIRSKRTECKDSHLHRAFKHADGSRLGSGGRPKISEGGDILYVKPASMKPRTQQQLQQTADQARKHIPGAARLLAAMMPGQLGEPHKPSLPATVPQYGPGSGSHVKKHRRQGHSSAPPTDQQAPGTHPTPPTPSTPSHNSHPSHASGASLQPPSHVSHASTHVTGHHSGASASGISQPSSIARQQTSAACGMRQSGGGHEGQEGSGLGVRPARAGLRAGAGSGPAVPGGGHDGQQGSGRGVRPARADEGSGPAEGAAEELVLQEDEVDWGGGGGGVGDPALQHALAVIRARGGLQAPDPNRPFQSCPTPTLPQAPHNTPKTQNTACQQSGDVQQSVTMSNPQGSNAASTGSQASRAQTGARARATPAGGAAGVGLAQRGGQATPQARVLAKLGLSKGGHASRAGSQASTPGAALQSTAAPSGFAAAFGSIGASQGDEHSDTRYKDLVNDEDHDRLTRVLTALEKKDEMQQRMEAITKLNVTAFQCKTCGTTSERRRPDCRQHDVQRVTATKRWWQCCHCNNRFSTVAVRLPKERCPKCNDVNMEFKAASMARSVKDKTDYLHASREAFKARGVEHAFALNSQS